MNTPAVPPITSFHTGGLVQVVVESFGYLHGPPPTAHLTIDVRDLLRNPHADPAVRELTGLEVEVRVHVMNTVGAVDIVTAALWMTETLVLVTKPSGRLVKVAIGCERGRHRSVVLANELANRLLVSSAIGADVSHRDILRPVVQL